MYYVQICMWKIILQSTFGIKLSAVLIYTKFNEVTENKKKTIITTKIDF